MAQIDFHTIYKPTIANPFVFDKTYVNLMASPSMQPYIRCFWGSTRSFNPHISPIYDNALVIPDTCFDMIFIKNHITGLFKMLFTGLNNSYSIDSWSKQDTDISIFAVRFNFWTMNIISKFPMTNTLNQAISPIEIFPTVEDLCKKIFDEPHFHSKIVIAEQYIKKLVNFDNISAPFFNGVDFILKQNGVGTLKQLSEHLGYSERQVQRIFLDTTGITPKHLMNLVRYQSIWQEMLSFMNIDYMDAAHKYGYVDQSHLIADFKKYHSLTPKEAINKILK